MCSQSGGSSSAHSRRLSEEIALSGGRHWGGGLNQSSQPLPPSAESELCGCLKCKKQEMFLFFFVGFRGDLSEFGSDDRSARGFRFDRDPA